MATLNAKQAADYLGVAERSIRRWIKKGKLVATKRSGDWQIKTDDLDKLSRINSHLLRRSRTTEFAAMEVASSAIQRLGRDERQRVLKYLNDRFAD